MSVDIGLEQQARELLLGEFEREGHTYLDGIRSLPLEAIAHPYRIAILAVQAALASREPAGVPKAAPGAVPTMADAVAAGDGTLHGAIDHWQERALKSEAVLSQQPEARGVVDVTDAMVERAAYCIPGAVPTLAKAREIAREILTAALTEARNVR